MSTAVIQGAGGSIGTHFTRHLLARTSLNVVATSRNPDATRKSILDGSGLDEKRLTVLKVDGKEERTIEDAAKEVEQRFGSASLRLLLNVSGVVSRSGRVSRPSFLADLLLLGSCTPTSRLRRSTLTSCWNRIRWALGVASRLQDCTHHGVPRSSTPSRTSSRTSTSCRSSQRRPMCGKPRRAARRIWRTELSLKD